MSTVTLDSETAVLPASRSQPSSLAVLVHRLADPVDARVVADGYMIRINQDDLVVFISSILIHPVGVKHTKISTNTSHSLFRDALKVSGELDLVDTLVLRLAIDNAFVVWALSATSANSDAVADVSLLCLVAKLVCLISSSRTVDLLNLLLLSVLPGSHTKQETHYIALLLAPELLEVLVGSHIDSTAEMMWCGGLMEFARSLALRGGVGRSTSHRSHEL